MKRNTPTQQELLALVERIHPDFKPVWDGLDPKDQAALAAYFLPHRPKKFPVKPVRPKAIKWYCPFASQAEFPSGHRYCVNVYVGCGHRCKYCYATAYEPDQPATKRDFRLLVDRDLEDLDRFDVPPAPVHLSNSTDLFQSLERHTGDAKYALERILAHRHRFTTVTILTKNPLIPVNGGYMDLFQELSRIPADHPKSADFRRLEHPAFQVQVSLAFWQEPSRTAYDQCAPTVQARIEGLWALQEAGIPVVVRIDPLFPRSPLPTKSPRTLADFGLVEAQTYEDLENLVRLAKELTARHIVYSPARVVQPRGRSLCHTMKTMRSVYQALAAPANPPWHGGSWRLPRVIAKTHVVQPFLEICKRTGVQAKYCMQDLIETF